jgi:antitoxin ParD1/3/4
VGRARVLIAASSQWDFVMDASQIQITLPGSLTEFVVTQVEAGKFKSPDEYVSALVSAERKRQAIERLEALIQEGIDSGPPIEVDDAYWERKRRELTEYLQKSKQA